MVLCVIYESREFLEVNSQFLTDHCEGCSQHKIDHLIQQSQSVQINLIGLNQVPVGGKGTFVTLNSLCCMVYGNGTIQSAHSSFVITSQDISIVTIFNASAKGSHIPVHFALSEMVLLRGDNLTGVQ